jgi:hypothetical protein
MPIIGDQMKYLFLTMILLISIGCGKEDSAGPGNNDPPPATDTEKPYVEIISPPYGADVGRSTLIRAHATDDTGIWKVVFYVTGENASTDYSAPYEYEWRASFPQHQAHKEYRVRAIAYDHARKYSEHTSMFYSQWWE